MQTFNRDMLPILGVTWREFDSEREAVRFAKWAERTTRNDQYPCDAYAYQNEHTKKWEVKVVNW